MHIASRIAITVIVTMVFSAVVAAAEIAFPKTSYESVDRAEQLPEHADAVLFVVIDQTTGANQDEKWIRRVQKIVVNWMQPGRAVEVIQFSAYVPGRATEIVTSGRLDPEPTQQFLDSIKRSTRGKFNKLHKQQKYAAKKQTIKAIKMVFDNASSDIPKSEILFNLHRIAKHISDYKGKKKTILLVSDMLENSSVTSFYQSGKVRTINPDAEMESVHEHNLLMQFNENVTIYIIGLGYGTKSYLGAQLGRLKMFWENYFMQSNVQIGEIGTPLLLNEIE